MIPIKALKLVFIGLVMAFLVTYFIGESGYYEYELASKKNLTEEQIKKFEEDVKAGNAIDINDYVIDNRVDYTSSLSRTTYTVTNKLNNYLKRSIESVFKVLNKMVQD